MPPEVSLLDMSGVSRPAAFLDRDGVINVDTGYPHLPDELVFTPTAVEGIRLLNDAGWLAIVVSNQSGVARGMFGLAEVEAFHAHIQAELSTAGAHIDAFYYCPYHPDGSVAEWAIQHEDRKPGPGMILRAMRDWPVDRAHSVLIGDKVSDMEAASAAGVRGVRVESDICDLVAEVRSLL